MTKKRRIAAKRFLSRRASSFRRKGRNLRVRWRTWDKTVWFFVSVMLIVTASFGILLKSVYTAKVHQQNLACLALNIYHEARGEPARGQYAVAEVTMNRVASSRYPDSVCAVVYQKNWDYLRKRYVGAFSWTEFTAVSQPKGKQWQQAQKIAEEVYYGRKAPKEPKLANALHYHADYVRPKWSRDRTPLARIGNHIFYR